VQAVDAHPPCAFAHHARGDHLLCYAGVVVAVAAVVAGVHGGVGQQSVESVGWPASGLSLLGQRLDGMPMQKNCEYHQDCPTCSLRGRADERQVSETRVVKGRVKFDWLESAKIEETRAVEYGAHIMDYFVFLFCVL
jgi:hypothetical protein